MSKEQEIAALTETRNQLYVALRDIPEEILRQPNAIERWSIADLCGHISAWEDRLITLTQQVSQGDGSAVVLLPQLVGVPASPIVDFGREPLFDEAQWQRRRSWSWREILGELVLMREETGWTLANMDEATFWRRHPVRLATGGTTPLGPVDLVHLIREHDRLHTEDLLRWRRANGL